MVFTASTSLCSLSQNLGITATGQTGLTLTAEIAYDGNWTALFFGFYTENVWDRVLAASVDVTSGTTAIAPDTTGAPDEFHTVTVTGNLPSDSNPVRVFIGSSATPFSGGAGLNAKFAIDNVRATPPASKVEDWILFR